MTRTDFLEAMQQLCDGFGHKLNERQMNQWYQKMQDRGIPLSILVKAADNLSVRENRFPALAAIIKECAEIYRRHDEEERLRRSQAERQGEGPLNFAEAIGKGGGDWAGKGRELAGKLCKGQIGQEDFWEEYDAWSLERRLPANRKATA